MPFAEYKNFAECVRKNSGKKNPQAYCGAIKHQVEGKKNKKKPRRRTNGWRYKKDNKMRSYGDTDYKKKLIRINKKKSKNVPFKKSLPKKYPAVLDTIVHEDMHRKHPKMYERNVRKKTERTVKKMSPKTKKKFYSLV